MSGSLRRVPKGEEGNGNAVFPHPLEDAPMFAV